MGMDGRSGGESVVAVVMYSTIRDGGFRAGRSEMNEIDWQTVRDVLATEVMGWHKDVSDQSIRAYGTIEGDRLCWWSDDGCRRELDRWQPDTNWAHCGAVIEAMQAKGWHWQCTSAPGHWYVSLYSIGTDGLMHAGGEADTLPQAVALAAYRAVKGENI